MNDAQIEEVASALHRASARLLRELRRDERDGGLSAPRLSALSALVVGGPTTLAALASAEELKAPTMSRLVEALVSEGLATRETDPANRRRVRIAATDAGRTRVEESRARRLRGLTDRLRRLAESEQRALQRGVEILDRVTR